MKRSFWIWFFCLILMIHPTLLGFLFSLFFCDFFGISCNYGLFKHMSESFITGAGKLIHTLLVFGAGVQIIRLGKPADSSKPDPIIRSVIIIQFLIFLQTMLYTESVQHSPEYQSIILLAMKASWIFNSLVTAGFFFYLSFLLKSEFLKIPSFLIIGLLIMQFLETDQRSAYLNTAGGFLISLSIAYSLWNSKVFPDRLHSFRLYSVVLIIKFLISNSFTLASLYFGKGNLSSFFGMYGYMNMLFGFLFQLALFNAFWHFSEKEIFTEQNASELD